MDPGRTLGGHDVSGTMIAADSRAQLGGDEPAAGQSDRTAGLPASRHAHQRAHPGPAGPDPVGGAHHAELPGLTVTRPSLEDVYLRITGQAGIGAGDGR